jgi:hypothetical protein
MAPDDRCAGGGIRVVALGSETGVGSRVGGGSAGAEVAHQECVGVDVFVGDAQGVYEDLADGGPDLGVEGGGAAVGTVGGAGEVAEVPVAGEAGDDVVEVIVEAGRVVRDGAGGVGALGEDEADEIADGEVGEVAAVEEGFEVAADLDREAFFEAEDDVEEVEAHGGGIVAGWAGDGRWGVGVGAIAKSGGVAAGRATASAAPLGLSYCDVIGTHGWRQ